MDDGLTVARYAWGAIVAVTVGGVALVAAALIWEAVYRFLHRGEL